MTIITFRSKYVIYFLGYDTIFHQICQWNLCHISGDHNLNMLLHRNLKSQNCEFVLLFLISQNYEAAVMVEL
jgi:hypothetical protein